MSYKCLIRMTKLANPRQHSRVVQLIMGVLGLYMFDTPSTCDWDILCIERRDVMPRLDMDTGKCVLVLQRKGYIISEITWRLSDENILVSAVSIYKLLKKAEESEVLTIVIESVFWKSFLLNTLRLWTKRWRMMMSLLRKDFVICWKRGGLKLKYHYQR